MTHRGESTDNTRNEPMSAVGFDDDEQQGQRSNVGIILLMIAACMLGVTLSVLFSFHHLDRIAENNVRERVMIALNLEALQLEQVLEEYSFWDEAHEKTVVSVDHDWLQNNTGEYIIEKYQLEFTMSVTADGRPSIVSVKPDYEAPSMAALRSGGLDPLIDRLQQQPETGAASAWLTADGNAYLVSADLFRHEDSDEPRADGSFLLFAQRLDSAFIAKVAERYQLPGLHQLPALLDSVEANLNLTDASGRTVGHLRWPPPDPGNNTLAALLAIVLLCFVVAMFLIRLVLVRDRRRQKAYEERLYALATRDFLTGISNRREFMGLANSELQRARRERHQVSLLLLDLDRFKRINDSYGHEAGDAVLIDFTTAVRENLRDFDLFARIGGEEFVAMLPGMETDTALSTAERLRQMIEQREVATPAGDRIRYTISIGLAQWDGSESIDKLIARADDAMYRAKEAGRNRVEMVSTTGSDISGAGNRQRQG